MITTLCLVDLCRPAWKSDFPERMRKTALQPDRQFLSLAVEFDHVGDGVLIKNVINLDVMTEQSLSEAARDNVVRFCLAYARQLPALIAAPP